MRNEENVADKCTHIFIKVIFSTPQDSILPVDRMNSNSKLTPRLRVGVAAEDGFIDSDSFLSVMKQWQKLTVTEPVSLASCASSPLVLTPVLYN